MQNVARLITQFIPYHYQLSLDLDRPARAFQGMVTIHGTVPTDSKTLTVHAKDLVIDSVTFDGKAATFKAGNNDELLIVHPAITAGEHIVVIAFSGKITDAMHGLYPCYFVHNGVKKELLATQFESHHAREVFPCVDEPEAKATFDLTLTTEKNIIVLSNMPVKSQKPGGDRLVTSFDTTPRMSTYLLAWVVGELHKKSATTKSGVEVNVWATQAQAPEMLDFALEQAAETIEFFDEYFGTAYPLPKSDHVALPDFTAGAMENWGLITYREVALLAHPTTSSVTSKQYVARVIAHELSHQWFGNLVTMKWWDDLWLNESFATLMEYVALDALHPEWEVWMEMSNFRNILALRRDAIDGVQPVQTGVNHPDEISALFDGAIVYAKGARLLRMLQHYVGEKTFQKGLRTYFAAHAYGSTEAADLWKAMSSASKKDIHSFMSAWLSQPGYPVVSVERHDDTLQLHQKRFFIGPHATSDAIWPIPLDAADLPALLETQSLNVPTPQSTLVHLNANDAAHFLTRYDEQLLREISEQLSAQSPLSRLQFLNAQILLARGGEVSAASLLPLLLAYQEEVSQPVWDIVSLAINELKLFVESDETTERRLKDLVASLGQPLYQRLGWTPRADESSADTKLRSNIIAAMLYSESRDAVKKAIDLYHSTPLEKLNPELRSLIIGAAVRHDSTGATMEALIQAYQATSAAELRENIAWGLSQARKPKEIKRLLALLMDQSIVRPQDIIRWFSFIIGSRYGRELAWQWLQGNWTWVKKTFEGDKSFDYFPRIAGSALRTRKHLEEYRAFFTSMQNEPALSRVIAMGLLEIEGKADFIERDAAAVHQALAKQ